MPKDNVADTLKNIQDISNAFAVKAVIETFTDLIKACELPVNKKRRCIICGGWDGDCDPGCDRLRASKALAFLLDGMK